MTPNENRMMTLAANCIERVKHMCERAGHSPDSPHLAHRVRRDEMIVDFFSGAYIAFRLADDKPMAQFVGGYTAAKLAQWPWRTLQEVAKGNF